MPTTLERGAGLESLWARLSRPYDPVTLLEALLGFPLSVSRQLNGAVVATCDEAEELLDRMPMTLRSLAIATTDRAQRCYGEIRGPVMWAETVSARAASIGDIGLFVCAMPDKAFDTDENRVLAAALSAIRNAGLEVERSQHAYDDAVLRRARHNAGRAIRYLEHRSLAQVPRRRPNPRAISRTRAGTRRRTYQPALDLLARTSEPFSVLALEGFCDERTTSQHDLLAALADGLEERGRPLRPLRTHEGALMTGPLWYRHPRNRGDQRVLHGVRVGRVLVDVPESIHERDRERARHQLDARSQGHPSVAVLDAGDVDAALDLALELGLD
jgi:hypothetical protein